MPPETRYAKNGDVNIAHQVLGDGPLDLVLVHGWVQSFDARWEVEAIERFYQRLASFSRLILFDKRGTGLSDRVPPDDLPTLETRMDDMRAVMDDVGAERAAVLGHSEGGAMCALFAATYPERTQALVMSGSAARTRWAPDYPLGAPDEVIEELQRSILENWGVALIRSLLQQLAPSIADDEELVQAQTRAALRTDIVGSTELAADLGDRRWRDLLERHNSLVRRELARFRGRELSTAGDGFLATFDGPARAVVCAVSIRESARALGLQIRFGLHTGELELAGSEIRGIAVHTGARVAAKAGPGEVLTSSTVKDLVAGSGLEFEDRGSHELKGVPGEWRLYAVASA
jgi:class 3 adenylate cyclase